MGFLDDVNFNDVVEPHVVSAGEEYRIRILDIKKDEDGSLPRNKNGDRYLMPLFDIPDEVGAISFNDYMGLPTSEQSDKERNAVKYKIQQFLKCFGFDPSDLPDDPDDLVGADGYAILGVKNDAEYGDKNFVRRYLVQR